MSTVTIVSRITHASLMKKSKSELAYEYLLLCDMKDQADAGVERLTYLYNQLLQHTSDEVDEYNAGHDAGEKGFDRDMARIEYLDGKVNHDVFDTGWVMAMLKDDASTLDKMLEDNKRLKAALQNIRLHNENSHQNYYSHTIESIARKALEGGE